MDAPAQRLAGLLRVAGRAPIAVDVRIIAATNRDPELAVKEGKPGDAIDVDGLPTLLGVEPRECSDGKHIKIHISSRIDEAAMRQSGVCFWPR